MSEAFAIQQVPASTIALMAMACAASFAIPVALFVWLRRRGAATAPFLVGCLVFVVAVLVLESAVHGLVLGSPLGASITGNVWAYALYGGAMAGLFEEIGRYVAFSSVLRRYRDNDMNALMYGVGHGGCEAVAVLGLTMAACIGIALAMNSGDAGTLFASVPPEAEKQLDALVAQMAEGSPATFLFGVVERVIATALQIALTVLVWFSAKERAPRLLVAAIAAHAFVDATVAVLGGIGAPAFVVEPVLAAMTLAVALYARRVWRDRTASAINHRHRKDDR